MKKATYEGQAGWYDEGSQEFFADAQWKQATYEGKQGLFNSETSEFVPDGAAAPAPEKKPPESPSFTDVLKNAVTGNIPETMSMIGGGLVGAAAIPGPWSPAAGAVGAGLLYGGTKLASRYLNNEGKDTDLYGAMKTGAMDVGTGSAMEAGGGLITGALSKLYQAIPKEWAGKLYNSVLKPSTTLTIPEREAIANTGIRENVLPNVEGLAKVKGTVKELNNAIEAEFRPSIDALKTDIENDVVKATYSGHPISTDAVVERLKDLKALYQNVPGGAKFLRQVEAIEADFLQKHGSALSLDEAQTIKKNIYKLFDKHYGELANARIEANKQVARGLKEEMQSYLPEIQAMNKREGELLDLQGTLERAVARLENREVLGLTDWIAGAAGSAVGGGVGYLAGGEKGAVEGAAIGLAPVIVKKLLTNPETLAQLAINMSKATGGKVTPGMIKARIASYLAIKAAEPSAKTPTAPPQVAEAANMSAYENPTATSQPETMIQ